MGKYKADTDSIRRHAQERYIIPARRRGERTVLINAGRVHKDMGLHNSVPMVCQALRSKKFLDSNGIRLISQAGPPSGLSTTVTLTYEWINVKTPSASNPWQQLRGALKEIFADLGGGEAYLEAERDNFYGESRGDKRP